MRAVLLFFLILLLNSCKDKVHNDKSYEVVSKESMLKNWKKFEKGNINLNIPKEWIPQENKDALVYIPIDKHNDLYYVILKYQESQISIKDYLKEIFKQLTSKNESFKYRLKEVTFQNTKKCYIIEFDTSFKGIDYKTYTLVYSENGYLYDFSYKSLKEDKGKDNGYQTFFTVLFSFVEDYNNIIDSEKFIVVDEKILKIEDI